MIFSRKKNSTNGQPRQGEPYLPEEKPAFTQAGSKRSSIHGQPNQPQPCLPEDEPASGSSWTRPFSIGHQMVLFALVANRFLVTDIQTHRSDPRYTWVR